MNDLKPIIESVKYSLDPFSVVSRYGQGNEHLRQGKNIRCPNQKHQQTGESPPCSMDYNTGLFYCHGCHIEGDILDFIGYSFFPDYDHENRGSNFKHLIDMLAGARIEPVKRHEQAPQKPKIKLRFDDEKLLEWTARLNDRPDILEWLANRGIHYPAWHEIGFTGDDPDVAPHYRNRIIIPHRYRNVITGIKWRSLPTEEKRYESFKGSAYVVPYRGDLLNIPQSLIYIVESELCRNYLYEQTIRNVVSISNGAFKRYAHMFLMVRKVVHIQDRKNGEQLARDIKKYLPFRSKSIFAPDECNDPSEWAQKNPDKYPDWIHV